MRRECVVLLCRTACPALLARCPALIAPRQAILKAGGFAEFSDSKKVKLVRNKPDGKVETTIVDVDAILTKGQIEKDPVLQADDRIIVPRKFINI